MPPKKVEPPPLPVPAGYAIDKVGSTYTVTDPKGGTHAGYTTTTEALDRCAALCWYTARAERIADPKTSPAVRATLIALPFGAPLP